MATPEMATPEMAAPDFHGDEKSPKTFQSLPTDTESLSVARDDANNAQSAAIAGSNDATRDEKQLAGHADLDGIKRSWNLKGLVVIWVSALLIGFATSLNNQTSNSFAPYATSSFASAPLLGTITVVQAVASSGRYRYPNCIM